MKFRHLTFAILSITVFSLFYTNVKGETISFSHFHVNDGLSQSTVVSSCQDSIGHMWFATMNGLNRFDGYRFHIYKNIPGDTTSIIDNIIKKVYVDQKGMLWIGTSKGFAQYNDKTETFRNVETGDMTVSGIVDLGDERQMMIAVGGCLRFFDREKWEWDDNGEPYQSEKFGATIMHKSGDMIWIGTQSGGLFCYSIVSKELKRMSTYSVSRQIQCIISEDKNSIWIATEGEGLHLFNHITGKSTQYRHDEKDTDGINSDYIRTLCKDINGRLWVGTVNGLNILENGTFTSIQSNHFLPGSLSQSSVRCISRDSQGGMWLGTWFGGINYWHPLKNKFQNIQRHPGSNSLNDNIISCIAEDKDNTLWIGTNSGGVNHFDTATGKFRHFIMQTSAKDGLVSNDIKAIHIDNDRGLVFVGAHAGGLSIINKRSGHIHHCIKNSSSNVPIDIYAIIPADKDNLWIGSLKGLKSFNIDKHQYRDIDTDIKGEAIKNMSVHTLLKDSKERLWVGGDRGIMCFKNMAGGLIQCTPLVNIDQLQSSFVQCIYENATNLIWIGSRQGLFCYDDREGTLIHYTSADGLPSNFIHGIEEDSYGRLWISTDQGLSCFNPFIKAFRNYTIIDGLQSNQFNPQSHCRRDNGEMMFGGINGITTFIPEKMEENPFTPRPIITSLHIFNKSIRPGDESGILSESINYSKKITLRHDQNSFSLGFTVINYLSGRHNTYSYKLEEFDKDWFDTSGNSATYSNLPHGNYRFMIKVANNDGKWNTEATVLDICIKPVWYMTKLAILIYILLGMGIIWLAYRTIVAKEERESRIELDRQEKQHQEEIHQMKTRFFINISHEMRTPLTLIINPLSEMISKCSDAWMKKQLKYLERNAQRLLHLVNQLMDYRRAELGVFKLKVHSEDVHKIVKENWAFYEKLAQSKKLKYTLESELKGTMLNIDGQYLELILNNLISNAFKYTDKGEVKVKAHTALEYLIIEVSDTGSGIPADQQDRIFERFYRLDNENIGSGIGLSLVHKLVELHHGRISLESQPGKGSRFIVSLPISLSAYSAEELESSDDISQSNNSQESYIIDAESIEEDTADNANTKRGKILIAEDNDDARAYMKTELSEIFDISLAKNGEEAIQILKEEQIDLVITDMMMPLVDGKKLCAHIKQNTDTYHIPVIMLSAKTDKRDQLDALKAGADDFIAKPFSMAVLIAKIRNTMRTRHHIQEKMSKSMEIAPEKISFNAMDEQILNKAIAIVEKNIDNTDFSTEEFAAAMNMSRSNLHIKLKALTGESALDFIRRIRFNEACRLLKDGRYSIAQISDMVGFNTPSYFATSFKKYMGCLPTEYVKKNS